MNKNDAGSFILLQLYHVVFISADGLVGIFGEFRMFRNEISCILRRVSHKREKYRDVRDKTHYLFYCIKLHTR